jgi:hypothetical protein
VVGSAFQVDEPYCRSEPANARLSGLERRCLLQRIGECQEALQLTILGADQVSDRGRDPELAVVCRMLDEAQVLVERAHDLAQAKRD